MLPSEPRERSRARLSRLHRRYGGPFNSTSAEFLHNHPDDTSAIEAAKQLVHDYDVELWDGERFVGRLSPEAK